MLKEEYKKLFWDETGMVAMSIVDSLQKLLQNPSDATEIVKLVNYADVVIGDAKFLGDMELEKNAKTIVKLFKEARGARQRSAEIRRLVEFFRKLIH